MYVDRLMTRHLSTKAASAKVASITAASITAASAKAASTTVPVHPLLAERWSPRGFDQEHELGEQALTALLEAARWAPSAQNSQDRKSTRLNSSHVRISY